MGNLMTRYFRGGQDGFIGGHYAIWPEGIGDYEPNLPARKIGNRNAVALLKDKSMHGNANYRKLVDYLKQIQQKEEDKERRLLTKELAKVSPEFVDVNLKNQIIQAINDGEFGMAYTLIIRRKQTLQQIKTELASKHFQSPQKMTSFWQAQFFKYLQKRLEQGLDATANNLVNNLSAGSLTIEEVVNDWINDSLLGTHGVAQESLDFISEQAKNSLITFFTKAGLKNIDRNSDLYNLDYATVSNHGAVQRIRNKKRKSGKWGSTKKTKISDITEGFALAMFKGLSTELMAIAEQGSKGSATFSAGNLQKEIYNELTKSGYTVSQKADVISILAYQANIDVESLSSELYGAYADAAYDKVEHLKEVLENTGQELEDLFVIETNVKGYLTYNDLDIEQKGSFALRANNLLKMRNVLPANMADRLVFLLVNTFDECVASHKIEVLEQYFAATVAAWMWDDYDQFFDINEQTTIQRVRMFKSGSMYYSASQILVQGISDLEKNLKEENKDSFINVRISPPSFNAENAYENILKMPEMKLSEDKDNELILEKRWNYMRDTIMNQGTLSIDFSQQQLDRLLGNLKGYLGA